MATYVLVHGAFHGAWCWKKLIPLLEAAGHPVFAPSLTGLAERANLLTPEVGLSTHIQDIVQVIQNHHLEDVILVGHSQGAMVITGVVDRIPEHVSHLVYLDTFVPKDGESMADIAPLVIRVFRREARLHGDGWRVYPPRGLATGLGVTQEPDKSWVNAMVTPQSLKTFEEHLHLRNPDIVSLEPCTHILCTGDRMRNIMRNILFRRALPPTGPNWRSRRLPTGHGCMITMPRELADLLLEIADPVNVKKPSL
jgi:pimeloyl-ACP methyl ester carboxylesterase